MTNILELKPTPSNWEPEKIDLKGYTPESWDCIDCGINTAPGLKTRIEMEHSFNLKGKSSNHIDNLSEIYMVKPKVWKAAGMGSGMGGFRETDGDHGCLCIGCLEKRLGRFLTPKDFMHNHPFNWDRMPCTRRLQARRTGLKKWVEKQHDGSHLFCQVDTNGEVTTVPIDPMGDDFVLP